MKFLKYLIITVIGVPVLLLLSIYLYTQQRETSIIEIKIKVAKDITIPIEEMTSQRISLGHALGGGGDVKGYIKFDYDNIKYLHEVPYILELIKLYKDDFYLVYYDRETDFHNITYRFYKSTKWGSFEEINPTTFPKHIAIQNRFWYESDAKYNLVGLKPEKMLGSTTASMWYMIAGEPEIDSYEEFLKDYKEKYITNKN